jgi:hypothetical protein
MKQSPPKKKTWEPKTGPRQKVTTVKQRVDANGTVLPIVDYMDHAPMSTIFLFPALFRSLPTTKNKTPFQITTVYMNSDYSHCGWQSDESLGATDLLTFAYLCQCAAFPSSQILMPHHIIFEPHATMLSISGFKVQPNFVVFEIDINSIRKAIGLVSTNTSNREAVMKSLLRLSNVRMTRYAFTNRGAFEMGSCRLIGFQVHDEKLVVALNPEASKKAKDRTGVAWLNMRELRLLPSKPAQILHGWLSAWLPAYAGRYLRFETLLTHVWSTPPKDAGVKSERARILRAVIKQIGSLPGWIAEYDTSKKLVYFERPLHAGPHAKRAIPHTNPAESHSNRAESHTAA